MVSGLKKLSYEQCLRRLNLTTLEERRKRGDLIEHRSKNVDYKQFFQKEENHHRLRGHSSKVFIPSIRTNIWKSFFQPQSLGQLEQVTSVDADNVQTFKSRYGRFIKDMGN